MQHTAWNAFSCVWDTLYLSWGWHFQRTLLLSFCNMTVAVTLSKNPYSYGLNILTCIYCHCTTLMSHLYLCPEETTKFFLKENGVNTQLQTQCKWRYRVGESLEKVNERTNSKSIHSTRKSRTKVDSNDDYEITGSASGVGGNVESTIVILRPMKSAKNQNPRATRFQMKSNANPIKCADFWIDRKKLCRDYFFWSNFDLHDDLPHDLRRRVKPNSLMHKCNGNHKSCMIPTTIKNAWHLKTGSNKNFRKIMSILKEIISMGKSAVSLLNNEVMSEEEKLHVPSIIMSDSHMGDKTWSMEI